MFERGVGFAFKAKMCAPIALITGCWDPLNILNNLFLVKPLRVETEYLLT